MWTNVKDKCLVRNGVQKSHTKNVIMCCLIGAIARLRETVIDG